MKINDLAKFVLSVLLTGATIALAAFDPVHDDTDIFLANPNITAERPNVLLVLDNTANWNQPFTNEKNAIVQVVNGLSDQFNVGLMLMPETGSPNDSVDGGYVRFHVRQMTLANKSALASIVGNLNILNDKGNNATHGAALYEAYLYFAGKASVASHGKVKTDKDNTSDPVTAGLPSTVTSGSPPVTRPNRAVPPSDKDTAPAPLYNSPISDGCARNFIILISNGPADNNVTELGTMQSRLGTLTGTNPPTVISITPNGKQGDWADEMAKFMANADVMATSASIPNSQGVQNVYTYVVEVDPGTTGQGPDMTALMKSTAANGKGKYFGVTSSASGTAIVDALNAIFTEVQAVNSVFASTTLPVSVNVRGTNLNQVYIGVFRPDPNKSPRWLGNLKMYNLALNTATGTVFLADAANGPPPAVGNPAENSTTGFISETSPSFWTSNSSFWAFRDPSQNGPGGPSDKPDGDLVEKGGAAQQLRIAFANAEASSPARNLYTCTTGVVDGTNQTCTTNSPLSNTPFNTLNDAISAAALQLDTRFVDPLTAYASKPVVTLTDRIPVVYMSNTFGGVYVESLNNGANTAIITNLTTAVPKTVTSLTGLVPNVQTVALSSVSKVSGKYRFQAAATLPSIYVSGATVTISGTSNSLFNANWTIDTVDTGNNRFTITTGPSGSESATGGTATVTSGTINSTTAQATVTAHGYISGQAVTILGASPVQFNGTYNITRIDADHFTYTISTAAGNATGTITASGNTTTATATTQAPHGFIAGQVVTVSGASNAAYNGAKTIIDCLPAPSCTGASTFRYSVGATPISPNTNTTGVTAFSGGTTTVRARIPDWWGYWSNTVLGVPCGSASTGFTYPGTLAENCGHGFTTGQTVYISGSDVSGYNGSFVITVDPPGPGEGSSRSFTFTTSTVLPGNASFNVWAATFLSDYIWGYAWNHNLRDGDQIAIEGPAPIGGNYEVYSTFGTDYFFYIYAPGVGPVTQTGYTVRPTGGINGLTGGAATPPQAYATVSNHGYPNGQEVRIAGASAPVPDPLNSSSYNGIKTIKVCDFTEQVPYRFGGTLTRSCFFQWDMFTYPLTTALGPNTNLGVTASIKSTLAQATSLNHGFANGSTVTIAGATPSDFNGTFTITVTDANHFTYTLASLQGDATGAILAAQSGGSSVERDQIIRWVRGEDNFQDENSNLLTTDIRASVHGDVLHSRPAVVNYNRFSGSDDDVFIYYGGNDGVFHAVKGGYAVPSGDSSGLTPGKEAWGFIPQEFFGQFKRLRNNSPLISSSFKKPYFMDGPIGVYTRDGSVPENGKLGDPEDTVNLYVANRRGGRFLYAVDVNNPQNPKFLWKITSATTGFGELGQTWSQPTVVSDLAGLSVPVLVFGAGYDPAVEDLDPVVVSSVDTNTDGAVSNGSVVTTTLGTVNRAMGRGIYVVNALTGALIWSAGRTGSGATTIVPGMIYAIPSDVTVIRNETTGIVNRAYVGDTGGNMWRIDFGSPDGTTLPNCDGVVNIRPNCTLVTKLASIADQSAASGRRKFLFPPDVVGQSGFDAVLVGSGDREHPFDSLITNRFYMFKDRGDDSGPKTGAQTCDPTITEAPIPDPTDACEPNPGLPIPGLFDATSNCIQDAAVCVAEGRTQAQAIAKLGADRGWFVTLGNGEKVVGNAVSIGGTTFFNTNQPSATAGGGTCGSNLGVARQYQVATVDATSTSDLNAVGGLTGADRSVVAAGGGYLPSPVHVVVMLGGKPVEAVISGIQVSTPAGTSLSARLRKFWYKEVDPK